MMVDWQTLDYDWLSGQTMTDRIFRQPLVREVLHGSSHSSQLYLFYITLIDLQSPLKGPTIGYESPLSPSTSIELFDLSYETDRTADQWINDFLNHPPCISWSKEYTSFFLISVDPFLGSYPFSFSLNNPLQLSSTYEPLLPLKFYLRAPFLCLDLESVFSLF